jgi:hypothetical protein
MNASALVISIEVMVKPKAGSALAAEGEQCVVPHAWVVNAQKARSS